MGNALSGDASAINQPFGLPSLLQEEEIVDDVGILGRDLGIGAVLDQRLHGGLDLIAERLIVGAEGDAVLLGAEFLIKNAPSSSSMIVRPSCSAT